jgi:hypothetical protein
MNEEALQDAYNLFTNAGYDGTIEEYEELISTNRDAFSDSFALFSQAGYNGSADEFTTLIGVKKKDIPEINTDSSLLDGSSDLSEEELLQNSLDLDKTKQQLKATEGLIRETGFSPDLSIKQDSLNKELERLNKITQNAPRRERLSSNRPPPTIEENFEDETITADLLERRESYIVPELNYLYGDQGFTFEQADILGQKIKVTAKNEKELRLNIGKLQNEGIRSEELKKFIRENKEESKALAQQDVKYEENKLKFKNEQEYTESWASISNGASQIMEQRKAYLSNNAELEKVFEDINSMTPEERELNLDYIKQFGELVAEHNINAQNIKNSVDALVAQEEAVLVATGKYIAAKQQQGTPLGLALKRFKKGFLREGSEFVQTIAIDLPTRNLPLKLQMGEKNYKNELIKYAEEYGFGVPENVEEITSDELQEFYNKDSDRRETVTSFTRGIGPASQQGSAFKEEIILPMIEVLNEKIIDDNRKQLSVIPTTIREDVIEEWGGKSISKQYEEMMTQGFWLKALYGVTESLPSFIFAANKPQQLANLYTLTASFIDEEMDNNPEFDNVTEVEKNQIKLLVGTTGAALEFFGFRNIMQQKGIVTSVIMRALGKTPKGSGPTAFRDMINQEITSSFTKGGLIIGAGAAAEFETGFLQQVSEGVIKNMYNDMKDKDMFDTPEIFSSAFLADAFESGALEAVGGGVISTMPAVANAYATNTFNRLTPQQMEVFLAIKDDPNISTKALLSMLKIDIAKGDLTFEQAVQLRNDYDMAIGLAKQVPSSLSPELYLEAMNLLTRRKKIEDAIEGKDKSLVKNDLNEIQEINKRLEQLKSQPETVQQTDD